MIEIQRNKLSIRIYEDSRPHHYKSSNIQKGLILVYDNQEICGEGIGFGAPVVRYKDKTYFAQNAELIRKDNVIIKSFDINSIFQVKIFGKYIRNHLFYAFTGFFSKIHRKHKLARHILNVILAVIRKLAGRPSDLVRISDKGKITCSYQINEDEIIINVNSALLDKTNCEEICIMNEQGASFFRKYEDTDGLLLTDNQIESWEKVKAEKARFSDIDGKVSFEMTNIPNSVLYRGKESFEGHLAWAGLAYSVPPSADIFEYRINLEVR